MDIDSLKKAFEKAKGNNLVVFLFFLLVSCSLWLSLTLNRVYETDICVSVRVDNIPDGILLENEGDVATRVVLRGEGTDLFGYLFDDGITVPADYSEFNRKGGRLAMPTNVIRGRVIEQLGPTLSIKNFLTDSVVAAVKRVTAVVPVKKNRLDLSAVKGCEIVSVKYNPESVRITALVDEVSGIRDVRTPVFACDGLAGDTVFELSFVPGKYIEVHPEMVQVNVGVSRYVDGLVSVPVEYVKFPSDVDLGVMPRDVDVKYEVLEINRDKVKSTDFSVQLFFDDYAYCVMAGRPGDLEKRFVVSSLSPFVRNAMVVGVERLDTAAVINTAEFELW